MFGINHDFSSENAPLDPLALRGRAPTPTDRVAHLEPDVVNKNDSEEWQLECWRRWPSPANWPAILDIYEAAAFLRVSHWTLRRAAVTGRDGRAALSHQRIGSAIRFRRADLEKFGLVQDRHPRVSAL